MCYKSCLTLLTNILINTYFNNSHCTFLIGESLDYRGNLQVLKISNFNEEDIEILRFGCQNFVIYNDDPQSVIENLEYFIKLQLQRYNKRKYLVLQTENSLNSLYNLTSIVSLQFVPDILVVVPETGHVLSYNYSLNSLMHDCPIKFHLLTHKFTGFTNNHETVLLDNFNCFNGTFQYDNYLYPDKITDMNGRLFKVATFSYQPYTIIDESEKSIDGTEMRLVLEYTKKHNCTLELVIDQVNEWGEIFDNWTGNGILGNVVMDKADVGIGALYSWYHEFAFLDLSMPIVRTGITCLAPAPRLLSGWLGPFLPFDLIIWIIVIISFVFIVLAYFFILQLTAAQINRENPEEEVSVNEPFMVLYMIVRIFLLQSWTSLRSFDRESIRCLLSATLILSLLLATCYNSGLASNMTIPRYEKAIKTVQDLADSNLEWGATHDAWIFSILSATQPTIVKIRNNFRTAIGPLLHERVGTRKFAFSVERLPAGHFAVGSYITKNDVSKLLLMNEDIYWEYCVLMSRKSSPLLPSINQLILQLHESGLPLIWEAQVALRYLDYQVQLQIKLLSQHIHPEQEPIQLKIVHIAGVYVIWAAGLVFATLTFFIELCVHKYKKN